MKDNRVSRKARFIKIKNQLRKGRILVRKFKVTAEALQDDWFLEQEQKYLLAKSTQFWKLPFEFLGYVYEPDIISNVFVVYFKFRVKNANVI